MEVNLGEFQLGKLLGRGGMGEVWQGRHKATGLDVAVKIVTAEVARLDRFHGSFRTEVQAMARLRHEGIALVLDYGRILPDAHDASGGHFAVDAPYLVMELCAGTLATHVDEIRDWPTVRRVLIQLLDALAHAHARYVIHRDIKPQNVLIRKSSDRLNCKLADFGLAQPFDESDDLTRSSGTPKYMAPEQIIGSFREQGPWTDLYALGCLAQWLVMGQSPFESEDPDEVLRGHLFDEPAALEPRFVVPDGLPAWVALLLEKDPTRRPLHAADARYLLEQLDVGAALGPTRPLRVAEGSEREIAPTIRDDGRPQVEDEIRDAFRKQIAAPRATRQIFAPPHRPNWRRPSPPNRSMQLVGAGIALYGLRPVPLVGRDAERDAIWGDLGHVAATGRPHVVVLRGDPGSGKSRLAEWIGERAAECGAARVLRAVHSPLGGPPDGLGRMVANHLRVTGLDRRALANRLERFMSSDGAGREFDVVDVLALADMVQGEASWTRAPTDRISVLMRFVERAAWDRPVYLWIDDAQWGRDALELAAALAVSDLPVLVLLTVSDEALVERALERAGLMELEQVAPHYREVSIGPLSTHDHLELIQRMLRLETEVAIEVAARTQGNPLFAVQLVGDWVERGLLVPGKSGFELRDREELALPDSIHNLWSRRIDRAIQRYIGRSTAGPVAGPDEVERWLWAGAVLGQEVDFVEWLSVCAELGTSPSLRLVEELTRLQLVERTATGFRFSHGMLTESLMRRAADAGATTTLHRAAAAMLRQLPQRRHSQRLAEHLVAACDHIAALDPLLVAAEEHTRRGDFLAALALDERRMAILDELQVSADSALRIDGWTRRARTYLITGQHDLVDDDLARASEALARSYDPRSEAQIVWTQLLRARHRNETTDGAALAARALKLFEQLGDRLAVARTRNKLGEFHRRLGDLASSVAHYQQAQEEFARLDEPFELGWSCLGIGTSQRHAREFGASRENINRALELFTSLGSRVGLGNGYNELGELERSAGNHATAERHYRQAIQLWARRGHTETSLLEYNLALTLVARGRWAAADQILIGVLANSTARQNRALEMLCRIALACCRASDPDEAGVSEFEAFAALHAVVDLIEPDIGELAFVYGERCRARRPDLARRSLTIAHDVFGLLEDERAGEVRDLLSQIS